MLGTSQLVVGMLANSPFAPPGIVRPGESAVVRFQVRVNSSTTGSVVNTATIEPDGILGPLPSFPASVTTPVVSAADLSVSKTGPVTAVAGTNVTYTVTVLNAGPGAANAVSLTDATPPGLTLVSVTGACTTLPCSLGTLADDETRTVSVTYAIPVNYSGADPIVNTATVTTTSEDTVPEQQLGVGVDGDRCAGCRPDDHQDEWGVGRCRWHDDDLYDHRHQRRPEYGRQCRRH